jgi:hypothetical protein
MQSKKQLSKEERRRKAAKEKQERMITELQLIVDNAIRKGKWKKNAEKAVPKLL